MDIRISNKQKSNAYESRYTKNFVHLGKNS